MRGYDTLFVQRVKAVAATHEILAVRQFLRACLARPTSVAELAKTFEVSRSTVYNWMTGQTVPHLHVHVIPRYRGDMDDPRGGVRHVIPSKGNYLRSVQPLATGGAGDPFSRHVLPLFETAQLLRGVGWLRP